jgi:hypothetical protein
MDGVVMDEFLKARVNGQKLVPLGCFLAKLVMELELQVVVEFKFSVLGLIEHPVGRLLSLLLAMDVLLKLLSLVDQWSDPVKKSVLDGIHLKRVLFLRKRLAYSSECLVIFRVKNSQ